MSVVNAIPLLLADEGYQISRSVRLRSSATGHFTRTFSSSNRKTWTWSGWVKRGLLANRQALFSAGLISGTFNYQTIHFDTSDKLNIVYYPDTTSTTLITTQVFRDPSAWYHIVVAWDTTQATASNRVKAYVNGTQVTAFDTATYSSQNTDGFINSTAYNSGVHQIGRFTPSDTAYLDGYLTEINFIDGQALTPSSFGETDAITGVWKPKKYAGTYGTNGFFLNFSDPSAASASAIGKDYSGNGNNWTPNNISVTSGATYDSMLDVPTLWADGGNGRGNYAVVNPLFRNPSMISEGNLYFNKSTIGWATGQSTIPLPASKTYFEALATLVGGANSGVFIGIATATATQDSYGVANQWSFGGTGNVLSLYNQTTLVTPSGSSAANDIFQVAYDGATGNLWFGKNNTWYNSTGGTTGDPSTGANPTMTLTAGTEVFPCAICYANGLKFTFGQRPFAYTPPTGFKALNTQNLPEPTIKKGNAWFDVKLYTGNGTSQTISGLAFSPDLVWQKTRTGTGWHNLVDQVRGAGYRLFSNTTSAESYAATNLTAFTSDGFSIGNDVDWNTNASTNVAWNWKEGATPGFDIVTYTGNGTSGRTVSHGLGVAPSMMIVKQRSSSTVQKNWVVYHRSLGANNGVLLNTTAASSASIDYWNNTAPTSSVFSLGPGDDAFGSQTNVNAKDYIAYLFAEVAGFSKAFSYTGNGNSDGPFVFTGFRPRYVLVKRSDASGTDWDVVDSSRDTTNNGSTNALLWANLSSAEAAGSTRFDLLSNGFKVRNTNTDNNASGGTYVGIAFAEVPYKFALGR